MRCHTRTKTRLKSNNGFIQKQKCVNYKRTSFRILLGRLLLTAFEADGKSSPWNHLEATKHDALHGDLGQHAYEWWTWLKHIKN